MYLFKDKDEFEISVTCKLCLKEIKFIITKDDYKKIEKFPFSREDVHGEPAHKFIVQINKSFEVEDFEIIDISDKKVSYSEDLTRQVLSEIGLGNEEIEFYFLSTGRELISTGEIELLIDKPKEECKEIIKKFVNKGLFKEIVGAVPYYTALPPYAALVSQLNRFEDYISEIKKETPSQLKDSFTELESQAEGVKNLKEIADFMIGMKENMEYNLGSQKNEFDTTIANIDKIKEISEVISKLEEETKELMGSQISELSTQFETMNSKIGEAMITQVEQITSQFTDLESKISEILLKQLEDFKKDFDKIQDKINESLKALHLGIVQKTVNQVIEQILSGWLDNITESFTMQLRQIKKISKDGMVKAKIGINKQSEVIQDVANKGLEKTNENFNEILLPKLDKTIKNTVEQINKAVTSTHESGENIKKIFTDVSDNFNEVVTTVSEKVVGISDKVFESFGSLKDTFSGTVLETLDHVLKNILDRLKISEITTKEFWEQAKKVTISTMKDIWFIRSVEGIKSHIKDQLSKAKSKVLIVAPELKDIDIESLKTIRKHINVRIATCFNTNFTEDKQILTEIDELPNVTARNRELQNLWGINRDYEEVILCVVSKVKIGDKEMSEVLGIGSAINEHIKIFVPILEDAWVGAYKGV